MTQYYHTTEEMIITSSVEEIQFLLHWVGQVLENGRITDNELIDEVTIAVDETVSNIILHAYDSEPDNLIHVYIKISSEEIIVRILDKGKTFEPETVLMPVQAKSIEETSLKGYGMLLMHKFMNEVTYLFKEKGKRRNNELTMIRKL